MTVNEFNLKWENYLEPGFDGLAIDHPKVIEYLDKEFHEEVKSNPEFEYAQIKLKFGMTRVYSSSNKDKIWEIQIDQILQEDED